jgi:hypothetical protein
MLLLRDRYYGLSLPVGHCSRLIVDSMSKDLACDHCKRRSTAIPAMCCESKKVGKGPEDAIISSKAASCGRAESEGDHTAASVGRTGAQDPHNVVALAYHNHHHHHHHNHHHRHHHNHHHHHLHHHNHHHHHLHHHNHHHHHHHVVYSLHKASLYPPCILRKDHQSLNSWRKAL